MNTSTTYYEMLTQLLSLSKEYNYFSIHCSNGNGDGYQLIAGFGAKKIYSSLQQIHLYDDHWKFGLLSYDLKNKIEKLSSENPDVLKVPDVCFFEPEFVVILENETVSVFPEVLKEEVLRKLQHVAVTDDEDNTPAFLTENTSREKYINDVEKIKEHIQQGDIYETNYCISYLGDGKIKNPSALFMQLNAISEASFACYTRLMDVFVLCSSPERFLKKQGSSLLTQPIKGTAKRGKTADEDQQLKVQLSLDFKERNENVMIVDVSRNDLSRLATRASVSVPRLFEVQSYKQVHQLVSTVTCQLKDNVSFSDIIEATFPPASMTGAPKIRAMQLMDMYEEFRRAAYSGSIGFIQPNGDFDFNVLIRSIIYNQQEQKISYAVGSAITQMCDASTEYEECMLKARAMRTILESGV